MINGYLRRNHLIIQRAETFNNEQIARHSVSPQGVGWNSTESQSVRHEQLLRILPTCDSSISINDVGCGYGALWRMLSGNKNITQYRGYDVSKNMLIATGLERQNIEDSRVDYCHLADIKTADYSVASGVFGLRFDFDLSDWHRYILDTLDLLNQYSRLGFSFNMLTSYSDPDQLKSELYYADPCVYFDICKRKYSRNVALLHDYGLYDFTILVRKT
ncbi:MAG: class I SAM-dependent methyltransferase [Hydrogenophaga sp.]|jgi:SAM-dependent methyltransferase|nr:class I SAM-dependent methyltransferase [Hydrogenophaga sp.]